MKKHRRSKRHRKAATHNPKHYSRKRRSHRRARHNPPKAKKYTKAGRVRVTRLKRYTRVSGGVRKQFVAHFRKNPLGGFIRIPTGSELMAVGVGALALPALSSLVKRYVPLPQMMTESWGGIATDLLIGSAASVAARRFVSPQAGDVMFVLTMARGVQSVAKQVLGAETSKTWLGLGADEEGVGYYENGQLGWQDSPGFGDESLSTNELPTMV